MDEKKRISFYSFTSCEGCMVNVLLWMAQNYSYFKKHFVINNMKMLVPQKKEEVKDDVVIVEGAISSKEQLRDLKRIRANAKILVAIGSCAITGSPSNNRNFLEDEEINQYIKKFNQLKEVKSVKDMVHVDYELMGCPIDIKQFNELMKQIIEGG